MQFGWEPYMIPLFSETLWMTENEYKPQVQPMALHCNWISSSRPCCMTSWIDACKTPPFLFLCYSWGNVCKHLASLMGPHWNWIGRMNRKSRMPQSIPCTSRPFSNQFCIDPYVYKFHDQLKVLHQNWSDRMSNSSMHLLRDTCIDWLSLCQF